MLPLRIWLFVLGIASVICSQLDAESAGDMSQFVERRGSKLVVGDDEFRFVSFNIPNLHLLEDNFSLENPSPWRWPNRFEIADALESVRQMGGTVVRIYVLSVRREGSDMGPHIHVRGPGDFNEEGFAVLDQVLAIAKQKGIRVIIPLVDNWKWWGGIAEYARFRGKKPQEFWTDQQLIDDFKQTIHYTLNRRNTLTGTLYKDDPAIFGWETGNELDSTPEWTRQIAAYMKEIDPEHLVIDGYALHGVRQESIDDPSIDVITTHHYPNTDNDYIKAILKAKKKIGGAKPYFVGEFGFVPTAQIKRVLDTVIENDISGALIWSLRFHNRDGGFYWHREPSGVNLYKAYHWPGFASGEAYDERKIMQLLREKAFAIRNLPTPKIDPPSAPNLLIIDDAAAISWQGSAGAVSYDVQRADTEQGPWKTIGQSISDAHVQYRPLFNDDSVVPGRKYYYRVQAVNSAGTSKPSNVRGPVRPLRKTLVDECQRTDRLEDSTGPIKVVSNQERKVQEDIHRFLLPPGSSATYRVDSTIESFRLITFSEEGKATIELATSNDGKNFSSAQVDTQTINLGKGDYGYFQPQVLTGTPTGEPATYLRISVPTNTNSAGVQLSRVEIRYGRQEQVAELKSNETSAHAAPLSPSILLFHKPRHTSGLKSVRRAADLNCPRVNVVATMHCQLDDERRVLRYGVVKQGRFVPLDATRLLEFQRTLRETFREADDHGMQISVVAHLNSWGDIYDWRNFFQFDPLEELDGFTYQRAVIEPIVSALVEAGVPIAHTELSLTGEMGHSVFNHAASYRRIVAELRSREASKRLALGVSLNFNRVAGESETSASQNQQVQRLIDESDFLGMSNYRWFSLPVTPNIFVEAIEAFMAQLQARDIFVPVNLPLHFTEVGIGGGREDGKLASSPEIAAKTPWQGSDRRSRNPWSSSTMQSFRVEYHRALLEFLKIQPSAYQVQGAYLWSEGSWDPMDLQDRGFADPQIIRLIQEHNTTVAKSPAE